MAHPGFIPHHRVPIPIKKKKKKKFSFAFFSSSNLHHLCCLFVKNTGQCCSDLCLWIHCLSLVLVPQGNSFILTQFYKSNRKITSGEIITIVTETGPLVFWVIVSSLADGAGRKDGPRWPKPLSPQVSAKAQLVGKANRRQINVCLQRYAWKLLCVIWLIHGNVTYLEILGANWVGSEPPCKRNYLLIQKLQAHT